MKIKIRNPKSEIRKDHKVQATDADIGQSSIVNRQSSIEAGMATVLFIALLAIMLVLVMVETSSMIRLRREVKLLEQQQIKHLSGQPTNSVSNATNP